jgi:acetyl esterase/lipase
VSVHAYGRHRSQVGELFEPEGPAVGVAVVLHGGFWRASYDRHLMNDLCRDLAAYGWRAWNLEYRRLGDGGGWPETFDDVAAGIASLPASKGPTVVIGHSAGGHLALWAAAQGLVTHAVSQAGVADLHEADRLGLSRNAARKLLGCAPEEDPERWHTASPAALAPLGVPQLLVHGEEDDEVPAAMSVSYARRAGEEAELRVLPGVGHYEHLDPQSAAWATAREFLEGLAR